MASDGTTLMFDISAAGSYYRDVAGIGRDDTSKLNQTSSKSIDSDGLLEISNPSDLDNLEFMTWGNNAGSRSYPSSEIPSSGLPANANARVPREWKIQNDDGDGVGVVTVAFDMGHKKYR